MPVKGDFKKLDDWSKLLRESVTIVEAASPALAETMISLVKEGFDSETDPYGRPWKKKQKPDGRKTLSGPTGRLKNGWHVISARRRGFSIAPSVDYAAPHQAPRFGRRPTRMMVPVASLGIPNSWQRDLIPIATSIAAAYFSGGRIPRSARAALTKPTKE